MRYMVKWIYLESVTIFTALVLLTFAFTVSHFNILSKLSSCLHHASESNLKFLNQNFNQMKFLFLDTKTDIQHCHSLVHCLKFFLKTYLMSTIYNITCLHHKHIHSFGLNDYSFIVHHCNTV